MSIKNILVYSFKNPNGYICIALKSTVPKTLDWNLTKTTKQNLEIYYMQNMIQFTNNEDFIVYFQKELEIIENGINFVKKLIEG